MLSCRAPLPPRPESNFVCVTPCVRCDPSHRPVAEVHEPDIGARLACAWIRLAAPLARAHPFASTFLLSAPGHQPCLHHASVSCRKPPNHHPVPKDSRLPPLLRWTCCSISLLSATSLRREPQTRASDELDAVSVGGVEEEQLLVRGERPRLRGHELLEVVARLACLLHQAEAKLASGSGLHSRVFNHLDVGQRGLQLVGRRA